jgi:hypothetical protein
LEATSDIFKLQDDKFWYVKTYLEKLHPKIMAFENKKEKIASAPSIKAFTQSSTLQNCVTYD